jgi:hypothetical protein
LQTFGGEGTIIPMSDQQLPEDQWRDRSLDAVYRFALALKELHESNPWPEQRLLLSAMNHLMTELWDEGFSQTEIREAFEQAIADMPRYAVGEEVRS